MLLLKSHLGSVFGSGRIPFGKLSIGEVMGYGVPVVSTKRDTIV
jgi:hypothetical protein